MPLTAFALNCSLKSAQDKEASSTDVLLRQVLAGLADHGVTGEIVRAVDRNIKPGVKADEGEGDAWPDLLRRIFAADIFVLGTPIWLGQPCSVCKRVLERLDSLIHDMDERKRGRCFMRLTPLLSTRWSRSVTAICDAARAIARASRAPRLLPHR